MFCEVVRRQSVSQGAAAVGISQSAASQVLANLEAELGFSLLDRSRRPTRPTAEGEIYYSACRELLDRHREALERIGSHHKTLAGRVRVASIYSAGLHTLAGYIRRFMADYPQWTIRLEYFHPSKVYGAVLKDEADLGVISYPRAHRDLEVLPWVEETMVLAVPPGHRFAGREAIHARALAGQRFVAFAPELAIRREIDRRLRERDVEVEVVSEFDNIETIKQALEVSDAAAILPRPSIQRELARGTLAEVALTDLALRRPVGIIHRRGKRLTPSTRRFLASLLEQPSPA